MLIAHSAAQTAQAATSTLPCDAFASGGQTCAAAYSTVRALSSGYGGPLYQVTRQSDGASTDIGLLSAGGYANAATQDGFCANTVCTISRIYDQSGHHSDLTLGPAGSSGSANIAARADALPVTVNGHEAYGVRVTARVGYRYVPSTPNTPAPGVAVSGQPESVYEVASGTDATDHCCFDFGNMETSATDTGNAHMDALIISTWCGVPPCTGNGPWIQADLENGVFMGNGSSANPSNVSENSKFITAVLRNDGQSQFALDGGDATQPALTSLYSGSLPSGYAPMHQEGGIGLGVGGDQSDMAPGAFFEGAIVSGYASNGTIASVQSNIAAAAYAGTSGGGPGVPVTGPGGSCLDVLGNDNGGNGTAVDIWSCQHDAVDQTWQYLRTTPDQGLPSGAAVPAWQHPEELVTMGRCLDIDGNGTAAGTKVELWTCNGVGGQKWVPQLDGTLLNPQSGLCLTDPGGSTAAGTVLDIEACEGAADQQFFVNSGHPISAPGGKCVDVPGDDLYGAIGPQLQIWDCQSYAVDQHWTYDPSSQTLLSLGKCLDIDGDSTASGAHVELWACNGVGGQKWVQQPDGTLINPQSGLCLTDPGDNTANGTQLDIEACTGGAGQQFGYLGAVALAPGAEVSFRATTACCAGDFIRHQNGRAIISPITVANSSLDKQDATWIVRPGLANSACLSFESKNYPNGYLRQTSGAVYQQQNDGTAQFASDATFCAVPGKSGQGESLSWNATPADYLRHYAGQLYVASDGGPDAWDSSTSWTDDVSWLPLPAWAP
ncbi:MAG TPA: arabinofuranosidase catalytic domain-containing protein [Actinocrinis sp.]|uniref:arabinofuranosidase catalytic domain-containing protein n=1 Tax=Actinocrinis sp. TaxID=1920516 RepID=UPI002D305754|nr:arabinofuranosidase catalytic domain-containing protein [Actinocrinis sp.]HZU56725.1 arabinofuranosidase catalytic domain-containing protein [Actinocrinis sp.]